MKKIAFLVLVIGLVISSYSARSDIKSDKKSQSLPVKIGYINIGKIIGALPETKLIEKEIDAYMKQSEKKLQGMAEDFQKKVQEFQSNQGSLGEAERNKQGLDLQKTQEDLRRFQYTVQEEVAKRQEKGMKPIEEKINKVVQQLAKELKYTHVFNKEAGPGIILICYARAEDDLTDRVLDILSVKKLKKQPDSKQPDSK